ncbi:MAG: S1 RNA-binding domain-containing protein [Actinomycetota bacterium]|nr:S1 RNA-binding domain-containing protein [Actinomycetota bacterium]
MNGRSVVVDGSNIATEGRPMPSLGQLVEAVGEYQGEFPDDELIVVVDATFGHRIDESERKAFDDAVAHNEIVSPPAGAIGRGDAFLLRIADKVGATVLSNDSFQEFHGEYEWLFHPGRLIGGKPVPGVGWIFTPRTPVRGPRSRVAVAEAKRAKKADAKRSPAAEQAIKVATDEAVSPSSRRRRRRRGGAPPSEPVNEPLGFIEFVAAHKVGTEVEGEVESFSSHGAFVDVGAVRCYIPLSAMGDPAPRAARDVLTRGETRTFVVQALDPPRRGIELALPGFAKPAGAPTEETVEDEIAAGTAPAEPVKKATKKKAPAATKKAATKKKAAAPTKKKAASVPAKKAATTKKAAAEKAAPAKKASAKKAAPAKEAAPAKKAASARKATAAKDAPAKKQAATAKKSTPAKKAATKKKAAAPAKAPATKATAKKTAKKAATTKA